MDEETAERGVGAAIFGGVADELLMPTSVWDVVSPSPKSELNAWLDGVDG